MCGIFLCIAQDKEMVCRVDWSKLARRGPNTVGACFGCVCGDTKKQDLSSLYLPSEQTTDLVTSLVQKHKKSCKPCSELFATFYGSVLHMRSFTVQPIIHDSGNVLLWNGELFHNDQCMNGASNDGEYILNTLSECTTDQEILTLFSDFYGPWSFVFWQRSRNRFWFGRDSLGRRSLLSSIADDHIVLSSVAVKPLTNWSEVPATGVFSITFNQEPCDIAAVNLSAISSVVMYPWIKLNTSQSIQCKSGCVSLVSLDSSLNILFESLINAEFKEIFGGLCIGLSDYGIVCPFTCITDIIEPNKVELESETILQSDAKLDCCRPDDSNVEQKPCEDKNELRQDNIDELLSFANHNRASFVHGSDCNNQTVLSSNEQSHQLNIDDSEKCDDTALRSNAKPDSLPASCSVRSQSNVQLLSKSDHEVYKYVTSQQISAADEFINRLSDAVRVRVINQPLLCSHCFASKLLLYKNSINKTSLYETVVGLRFDSKRDVSISPSLESTLQTSDSSLCNGKSSECYHASVAVLFSGGIDSLTLACLADRFVPKNQPIDLLNVAFELQQNNRKGKSSVASLEKTSSYEVPDRITGRQGLEELKSVCPDRIWNFVEINIPQHRLQEARVEHIADLLSPLKTVLDDSIGCALWFAAEGCGLTYCSNSSEAVEYRSPARVVLIGSGADEQLAGYSRHRVRFESGGWAGLVDEVKMEMNRISLRNLGRDDRIVSDHGREARFPFLDEKVVCYLSSLPMSLKANLTLRRGIGEKLLLRLAAVRLGLNIGAVLPKRAIQFGSRIAKLENRKEKADDIFRRNGVVEHC